MTVRNRTAGSSFILHPLPPLAAPSTWLYTLGRVPCRFFTTLWFDLKVYGAHHVPKHGGVLIASNHQSNLDPVLVAVKLHRPLSFLAKASLFEKPAF